MIEIRTIDGNDAELNVSKGTPRITMLLGIEMLIEVLLEEIPSKSIDDILTDLKRIYIRDNGGNDINGKN